MTPVNLLVACVLDGVLGDPRWLPHPIRLMGRAIKWYEQITRRVVHDPVGQRFIGVLLALGIPSLSFMVGWWVLDLGYRLHVVLGDIVWVCLAYTTLAARDLAAHAMAVYRALTNGSLDQARSTVSLIVGRDTAHLSEEDVIRASVESVAENTSDGVIAPLMYLAIGGPPLALAYKAINTLDSMVGHRTPAHLHIGWASARLDDLVNWLPARLSAVLLVVPGSLRLGTGLEAWHIFRRDGTKHPSPNSGQPEAAMAGALGIQLGGTNYYRGIPLERAKLGDPRVSLRPEQIHLAVQLMWIAFGLALVIALALLSL